MTTVFYGALVSPTSLTAYAAHPRALLAVSRTSGEIAWLEEDVAPSALQDVLAAHGLVDAADLVELRAGEFLMPGFVDTHTHAPQMPNMGVGGQYELLDWLEKVTFPVEAKFADATFARTVYDAVVKRVIDYGTTTCCYYGTLHLEATKALAEIVNAHGQRALVGKCNMDRESPAYYVEPSAAASVSATEALIAHIRALPAPTPGAGPLVHPVLTPRFAISTTPALLTALGALAGADPALAVQTHACENAAEIAYTRALFPPAARPLAPAPVPASAAATDTYVGVYDAYGLLRANTVLAHAVHLEPAEMALIAQRRAGVAHCPTSNFNLRSGCARVGEMLDNGIKVGLGTDVSGGFSPSILTEVQHASMCSKVVAMQTPADACAGAHFAGKQLSVPTLLHLVTLGGAQVCELAGRTGSLVPGKAFDALVVSVRADAGNPAVWDAQLGGGGDKKTEREALEGMLERFLFCGDDRNIRRVYVQGRLIGGKEFRGSRGLYN